MKRNNGIRIIDIKMDFDGYKITYTQGKKEKSSTLNYRLLCFDKGEIYNHQKKGTYVGMNIKKTMISTTSLKPCERMTYIILKCYQGEKNECFPSYETMSNMTGHSHTTLSKATKKLEKAGFLNAKRKRRNPDNDKYLSNIYSCKSETGKENTIFVPFNCIFSTKLNIKDKLLYLLLLTKANNQFKVAFPVNELLELLGIKSRKALNRHIVNLKKLGFIYSSFNTSVVKRVVENEKKVINRRNETENAIVFLIRRICSPDLKIREDNDLLVS